MIVIGYASLVPSRLHIQTLLLQSSSAYFRHIGYREWTLLRVGQRGARLLSGRQPAVPFSRFALLIAVQGCRLAHSCPASVSGLVLRGGGRLLRKRYCPNSEPSVLIWRPAAPAVMEKLATVNPARDRRVGLSAIGQRPLRNQYDALASPIPPHLASLVRQLEAQK